MITRLRRFTLVLLLAFGLQWDGVVPPAGAQESGPQSNPATGPSTIPASGRGADKSDDLAAALPPAPAVAAVGLKLLAAYPDALAAVNGAVLIWRDGTRMTLDDALPPKSWADWLAAPDVKDMLRQPYERSDPPRAPAINSDPGRARNAAFFDKMYGDCKKGEVASHLVDVDWLPSRTRIRLKATRINGVADRLTRISHELEALPAPMHAYLLPPAGTFACRSIAGTPQGSAHGYGIAVDISVKRAHYWRWSKPDATGHPIWHNEIPMEIVRIFERNGFIWGGRWYHYDTMHFEYRPELLLP